MTILINSMIFLSLILGLYMLVDWFSEVGVQEIVIHTEQFLLQETRKVRMQRLPELTSTKLWDKLELLLFYSGIRNRYPFFSAKIWLLCLVMVNSGLFIVVILAGGYVGQALITCAAASIGSAALLSWFRRKNLKNTEKYLLELVNLTESFAITGEEPVAILMNCSGYLGGPMGLVLKNAGRMREQGLSGKMLLDHMKVTLEHPKWQEFIHNLNVCSMYNSDFKTVFASSRKSIQGFLSSKKERQRVKQVARLEMIIMAVFGYLILALIAGMLEMPIGKLVWGNTISKGCTIYLAGIILLFFRKLGSFEKE